MIFKVDIFVVKLMGKEMACSENLPLKYLAKKYYQSYSKNSHKLYMFFSVNQAIDGLIFGEYTMLE